MAPRQKKALLEKELMAESTLQVMHPLEGDLKYTWDPDDAAETAMVKSTFDDMKRKGFMAYRVKRSGDPAEIKMWVEALHDLTKLRNPKDLEVLEKELAIHRGLIADDSEAFNTEEFDAKWAAKAAEDVNELMEHTPGGVAVVEDVTTEPAAETPTETTETTETTAPAEDAPIEDAEFLSQLKEFEEK